MQSLSKQGLLATFLTIFVSGCETSGKPILQAPPIPPLDPRIEAPCPDPGVRGDYLSALTANRLALAECRRRHQNVVESYNDARNSFGPE